MSTDKNQVLTRTTITNELQDFITDWANQCYQSKKVEGVSPYTLTFYKQQLGHFLHYCEAQVITQVGEITPNTIRLYLLWHEETGHNPGGLHAAYRVLRTFLLWYENEVEPEGWKNPIRKVKTPKLSEEPLEPVEIADVAALLQTCNTATLLDYRDRAILLFLLDTGARARELLRMNLDDVNLINGAVLIRQGKGRKPRTVFLGRNSRKSLRAYLKNRKDNNPALWITDDGDSLAYGGLRGILTRRANQAGKESPSLHSFRRAFAINMLRAGVDIYSLQALIGHSDLQVLRRYLKQTTGDLESAHVLGGTVDKAGL